MSAQQLKELAGKTETSHVQLKKQNNKVLTKKKTNYQRMGINDPEIMDTPVGSGW
jgi:hypothetical protein